MAPRGHFTPQAGSEDGPTSPPTHPAPPGSLSAGVQMTPGQSQDGAEPTSREAMSLEEPDLKDVCLRRRHIDANHAAQDTSA